MITYTSSRRVKVYNTTKYFQKKRKNKIKTLYNQN